MELQKYFDLGEDTYISDAKARLSEAGVQGAGGAQSHYINTKDGLVPLKLVARMAQFQHTEETENFHSPDFKKALEQLGFEVLVNPASNEAPSVLQKREQRYAEVAVRPQQAAFRMRIMKSCDGKCVVSGCSVQHALEACHIEPYHINHDDSTENGLLLRRDIHRLFDNHLLAINPENLSVWISEGALPDYEHYAGKVARLPDCVKTEKLQTHWNTQ